jgi:hypothetical protein
MATVTAKAGRGDDDDDDDDDERARGDVERGGEIGGWTRWIAV